MKAAIVIREWALASPVRSSQQVHRAGHEVAVVLRDGEHYGVGSVNPLTTSVNGDPDLHQVLSAFTSMGLSRLSSLKQPWDGFQWTHVHGLFSDAASSRWCASLLESAVLDLECSLTGRTWLETFGTGSCEIQGVASLLDAEVRQRDGIDRYRVKVDRTTKDFSVLADLSAPVLLDYNGDAPSPTEVVETVQRAGAYATVLGVEQAWAVGDFITPAAIRNHGVRVSHDESLRSVGDLRHAIRYEAIDFAAIKPARCGGFAVAREIAMRAREANLEFYIGGFFERPMARYRNHVLAASLNAGPSDVLHVDAGTVVSVEEAVADRNDVIERAERQGEWVQVGG